MDEGCYPTEACTRCSGVQARKEKVSHFMKRVRNNRGVQGSFSRNSKFSSGRNTKVRLGVIDRRVVIQGDDSDMVLDGVAGLVDLGTINVVDLLDGPQELIIPDAGSALWVLPDPAGFVALDFGFVEIAPTSRVTAAAISSALLGWGITPDFYNGAINAPTAAPIILAICDGTPIRAYLETDNNTYALLSAAVAWQANHVYPASIVIILGNDGHLWSQTAGGTSGATIPDFAGNHDGTVDDNGVTWEDEGSVPTTGTLHLLGLVAYV